MRANRTQSPPVQCRGERGIVLERFQSVTMQMQYHSPVGRRLMRLEHVRRFPGNINFAPSPDGLGHFRCSSNPDSTISQQAANVERKRARPEEEAASMPTSHPWCLIGLYRVMDKGC